MTSHRVSLADRFWAKVQKTDLCWHWTAHRSPRGYGMIRRSGDPAPAYAHRVAYELLVGPIPAGLTVDHLCRNRACVNPDHLEAVTNAENLRRGKKPTSPKQILSDRHAYEIRLRRAAGETGASLAREYGVAQQTICNVTKGRAFRHVGGPLT